MRVFNASMFGRGTLVVRPGVDEMQTAEFFETSTDANGVVSRKFRDIVVRFHKGAADVSDALGQWLVAKGHASPEPPAAIPQPQPEVFYDDNQGRPVYPPPIAVGTPLRPEEIRYIEDHKL